MRYERLEECKGGIEQGGDPFHALCDDCGGTYKIRTPVESVEMWGIIGSDGLYAVGDTVKIAWDHAVSNYVGDYYLQEIDKYIESMGEDGYTCEQVDVIRRKA